MRHDLGVILSVPCHDADEAAVVAVEAVAAEAAEAARLYLLLHWNVAALAAHGLLHRRQRELLAVAAELARKMLRDVRTICEREMQ